MAGAARPVSRAAIRAFLADRSGRSTAKLFSVGKDLCDENGVRGPGAGGNDFQRMLPGSEAQHLLIAVALRAPATAICICGSEPS